MKAMAAKQEELKRGGGSGSNYDFDKLEKGKNVRRVLPPKGDSDMFFAEGFVHYGFGEDGKKMVTCLQTFDKKCPVCEYLESIKGSKNKEDKEFYNNAKQQKKIYINVLNRDNDEEEETPKVLPIGRMILKQLIDIICDPDYGDITDFNDGRDITITKSGSGMQTEYSVLAKPKTSEASEQYSEEELDELLPNLEDLFVEKSPEELEAMIAGEEYSEDAESDDEDEVYDYLSMSIEDLKYLCKERDIALPKKVTKSRLISMLEEYDDEEFDKKSQEYEDEEDEDCKPTFEEDNEEDEEDDDLMNSIKASINKKRASRSSK